MQAASPAITPQIIVREMGLSADNLARRLTIVGFVPEDRLRIMQLKRLMEDHVQDLTSVFFDFLARLPEAGQLLSDPQQLAHARLLKTAHLRALVGGDYGEDYVHQRLRLALIYAEAKIDPRVFLGAYHQLLRTLGMDIMRHYQQAPLEGFEIFMSLKKVAFFDIGIIIDVLVFERERTIRQQQQAIQELSIPVLQLREKVLLLPLVGTVDALRVQQAADNLFRAIRSKRPQIAIVDVSGVALMDPLLAHHVLQAASSAMRMGTKVIVTGLPGDVARSLVSLVVDLDGVYLCENLLEGLELAECELRGPIVTQDARL